MGAQFSGQCYDSAPEAAQAFWSAAGPIFGTGSPVTVSTVEWSGTAWELVTRDGSTVLSVNTLVDPAFGVCDPGASALLGMELGWMIVVCFALAWAIRVAMARAIGQR